MHKFERPPRENKKSINHIKAPFVMLENYLVTACILTAQDEKILIQKGKLQSPPDFREVLVRTVPEFFESWGRRNEGSQAKQWVGEQ